MHILKNVFLCLDVNENLQDIMLESCALTILGNNRSRNAYLVFLSNVQHNNVLNNL